MPDFEVVCRLRTLAGEVMFDLHDHDAGHCPRSPIEFSDETWDRQVETALYLDGFAETSARLPGGQVVITMQSKGATWVECEQRRLAIRASYLSVPTFLLDVKLEGVLQTFRANRPDMGRLSVDVNDLSGRTRVFTLSFPVQPHQTVTGV